MKNTIIFTGKLIKCNRAEKEFKGKKSAEKLYITLAEVDIDDETMEIVKSAYKEAGARFTPAWVKEFEGFVNLSTKYELPFKDNVNGVTGENIEDYIVDGFNWCGATVKVSVNVKDGALYPKAIVIDEEGKEFDPFSDFEE